MIEKETKVVNLYKERYDVYIGRPGKGQKGYFGNPFSIPPKATAEERQICLDKYREYFYKRLSADVEFRQRVNELQGKVLGCFCKPKLCHGDVIAEYLNRRYVENEG